MTALVTYTDKGSGTTRGGAIRMAQRYATAKALREGNSPEWCRLVSSSATQIGAGLWWATVTISCSRP
ncbi:hypothetical protein [Allokutzneria oryzae]|uniref:Uncharacterized protein n=1 Tax=Allokutzneria oryzae TaxID=1378989 RepID=A0ABV5ZV71_9PSEU